MKELQRPGWDPNLKRFESPIGHLFSQKRLIKITISIFTQNKTFQWSYLDKLTKWFLSRMCKGIQAEKQFYDMNLVKECIISSFYTALICSISLCKMWINVKRFKLVFRANFSKKKNSVSFKKKGNHGLGGSDRHRFRDKKRWEKYN